MFGTLLYMNQRPGHYANSSGSIWRALKCGAGMEKVKWSEKVTNEQVRIGKKKTLPNNILRRKAN